MLHLAMGLGAAQILEFYDLFTESVITILARDGSTKQSFGNWRYQAGSLGTRPKAELPSAGQLLEQFGL